MIKKISNQWVITILAVIGLVGLGVLKGSWTTASAETIPTLPEHNIKTVTYGPLLADLLYSCGGFSFPADISVFLGIRVPPAGVDRYLKIMNPSNYLNRQNYTYFYMLGQPFDVKVSTADGGTEIIDFDPPLKFEITYQDDDIRAGMSEGDLKFYSHSNGIWQNIPTIVDKNNNTLTAYISHLSTFAVFDAEYLPVLLPFVKK